MSFWKMSKHGGNRRIRRVFGADVLTPGAVRARAALHIIIDLSWRLYHFPRVRIRQRAKTNVSTFTRRHARTHTEAYYEISQLACADFSPPPLLIKFHLQQLRFHQPITGRRAEVLIHAWLHQTPREYQSVTPILFLNSFSLFLSLLWTQMLVH